MVKFKWILKHHLLLSHFLLHFTHLMKLCGGKEESSLVCHCNHRRLGSANFNERLIILPSFCLNLLIVPYVKVPLLISLLVCLCCLSSTSEEATYKPYASLNWNCNEFPSLAKCAFFPRSFSLFLCALFCTIRRRQVGNVSKLPCHVLLMATLTATFLLSATISVRPVSAQSLALLTTDSTDSYEHEEDEDSEQTGKFILLLLNDLLFLSLHLNCFRTKDFPFLLFQTLSWQKLLNLYSFLVKFKKNNLNYF